MDPTALDAKAGPYATPPSLVSALCQAGSMGEFETEGRWYAEKENHGLFSGAGPVQVKQSCEAGIEVFMGTNTAQIKYDQAVLTEDYLFWRRQRVFDDIDLTIVDAFILCGRDAQGQYVGHAARCQISEEDGENCDLSALSMAPFGRLPQENESEGLELISEYKGEVWGWQGNFIANVRVHDQLAYVVIGEGGLRIVDVSDPTTPVEVGYYPAQEEESFNDVKIVGDGEGGLYALVASNARGMVVVDVTAPRTPMRLLSVSPSGEPNHGVHTIFTESFDDKSIAYLADGLSNVVTIWDVADPRQPVRLGQHVSSNEDWAVHDVFADRGRLYLNATRGGLLVADTQPNPASPVTLGRYQSLEPSYSHVNWVTEAGGRKVTVNGDEGFGGHFKIIDVDPASPDFMTEIGKYQTRPQVSAHNVIAIGEKAYAAYYQDGVRILDLSDPTSPSLRAYFNTWDPQNSTGGRFEGAVGIDVDAEAGLIYVADYPRGLMIFREL